MTSLELTRFSARCQANYLRSFSSAESQAFLESLLSSVAKRCESKGAIIGHIKLLGTLPCGGYFQGSVTTTRIPPAVKAYNVLPHKGLAIDLVVLVYGLSEVEVSRIVDRVVDKLAADGEDITEVRSFAPSVSAKKEC